MPLAFAPPAPNPARTTADFQFRLPGSADVALEIFDVRGARMRTLETGRDEAGTHTRVWDLRDDAGRSVPPGVYLSRLTVGSWRETRRLLVIR